MVDRSAPRLPELPGARLLRAALPAECAATLEAVIGSRRGRTLDVDRLADLLEVDRLEALELVDAAEGAFQEVFGLRIIGPERPWFDPGAERDDGAVPDEVLLSGRFADLLSRAPEAPATDRSAPAFGADTARWVGAIARAAKEPSSSLHFALRVDGDAFRAFRDLATLLRDAGVRATAVRGQGRALAAELLRAELNGGPDRPVALVEHSLLCGGDGSAEEDFAALGRTCDGPDPFMLEAAPWLVAMRTVCVWRVPGGAVIPAELDGLIAGAIGPLRPDPGWAAGVVGDAIGAGVGVAGVAAIAATLRDPRDAEPRGFAARLLACDGFGVDDACRLVARSLMPTPEGVAAPERFDPALLVHGDLAVVLARAPEVASHGGRILFHGPPGGGKSSLALVMATRMGEANAAGPPIVVAASSILVRPYGGTERLLDRLWRRAAVARSPLVIDELDAMCGVRDCSDGSGGNGYLVRVLTDEWLRQFDAHPGVPVLATVNEPRAVDPAVLRRFHAQFHIGAELPAHLERRAWASILGMDPPACWTPCGASPADFASARVRCRMLGMWDAASLAEAIRLAREARHVGAPTRRTAAERVH